MKPPAHKPNRKRPRCLVPESVPDQPGLPITARKDEIIQAIKAHPVVIISGETGSGKTTQIPKFCLGAGLGRKGMIGCTQPRRIAAVNVARRIAGELNQPLGESVGYKIRFEDRTHARTCIKMMTDGILLAETQTDPRLLAYEVIIVDEAHERSLNIDFTLGILRRLIRKRKNLKLIITSATIDTQKFSRAFDNAPVIEVSGRTFPVETLYRPYQDRDEDGLDNQGYVEAAAREVEQIVARGGRGDILIFMPTEQDIGETLEILRGKDWPGTLILPLFARLSAKEQSKIFSRGPGRKIIVSTNVAETSLTIPGIKFVVDTGLARIPAYSPRTRTTALPVSPISQSSANQRQGRCGRVENGICIRLYDEQDFESRPFFTAPEILRSNLAEVILRMLFLNLGDVADFPFIDPPSTKSIQDGFKTLEELGAIRKPKKNRPRKGRSGGRPGHALSRMGRTMARLPMDPKLSRILIEAARKGCLDEACIIATALTVSDVRQRPSDKAQAADQQHAAFKDPDSDFITLLNIWKAYKAAEKKLRSRSKKIRFCQEHFLSFKRLREWNEICHQIGKMLKEHGIANQAARPAPDGAGHKQAHSPLYTALHQSFLAGYLSNIARKKEKNLFAAARGRQAMIFPGSGLFNKNCEWIVAAEYVKTSQLFARSCARIDPGWLEPMAGSLCVYSHSSPRWEKKQGRVMVDEQVTLYGLVLIGARPRPYGKINPDEACDIFIRHALVQGEVVREFDFMVHNRELIRSVETLENKRRKRDILASEEEMFAFYQSRLPRPFYDIRSFAKFVRDNDNGASLKMRLEDLQKEDVDDHEMALYPDSLTMEQHRFSLAYEFNPGQTDDGVTIKVPAHRAALVSEHQLDSLVPGLFEEKIAALIRALPKQYRVRLMPVSQKAKMIAEQMPEADRPLFSRLSAFIRDRFNFLIPASAWSEKELPGHLKMRISIRDETDKEIRVDRDKSLLRQYAHVRPERRSAPFDRARQEWEKQGVTDWDFPDLDQAVILEPEKADSTRAWPALAAVPGDKTGDPVVNLRLFRSRKKAARAHPKGVEQLYRKVYADHLTALRKDINRSAGLKQAAPLFSGQTAFQAQIFDLAVKEMFRKNITTQKDFLSHGQARIKQLYPDGQSLIDTVCRVCRAYRDCFSKLQDLSFKHQAKPRTSAILTRVFSQLKSLVPPNFTALYDYDRICQLDRYIDALAARASKAVENPARDEQKAALVAGWRNRLETLLESLDSSSSEEKTKSVEHFFWMVEEYKISIFAQGIKTRGKISAKRLDKEFQKLLTLI